MNEEEIDGKIKEGKKNRVNEKTQKREIKRKKE